MPGLSKDTATHVENTGPVNNRYDEVLGYAVNFMTFDADVDGTPLLKGLPDDRCDCPHWGYVIEGRVSYTFPDHEEHYEAGDAFYLPPGHTPQFGAGAAIVQFSPAETMIHVTETMKRNFEAMMQASNG